MFNIQTGKLCICDKRVGRTKNADIEQLKQRNAELSQEIKDIERSLKRKATAIQKDLNEKCEELSDIHGEPTLLPGFIIYNGKINVNFAKFWQSKNAIYIANYVDNKIVSLNTITLLPIEKK